MSDAQTQTVLSSDPVEGCDERSGAYPWSQALPLSYPGMFQAESVKESFHSPHHYCNSGLSSTFPERQDTRDTQLNSSFGSDFIFAPTEMTKLPIPSTSTGNTTTSDMPEAKNLRLNKDRLDAIEREEDQIRDAREELLGTRFRLKHHRKELREVRQKTGEQEGALISQLRRLFQNKGVEFPVDLDNAFARIIELRDSLGSLEGRYEDEEQQYDQREWKYTQKEATFVAKLAGDTNIPLEEGRNAENDDLILHALEPAEPNTTPIKFQELQPETIELHELDGQQPPEAVDELSRDLDQRSSTTPACGYRSLTTFLELESVQFAESLPPSPRTCSEISIAEAHIAWNKTRKRIEEWILDTVSCSQHEKFVLRSLLLHDDLNEATWWSLVKQHWSSNIPTTPPIGMNAEDSYMSHATINPPIAAIPPSVFSDNVGKGNHKVPSMFGQISATDLVDQPIIQSTRAPRVAGLDGQFDLRSFPSQPKERDTEKTARLSNASFQTIQEKTRTSQVSPMLRCNITSATSVEAFQEIESQPNERKSSIRSLDTVESAPSTRSDNTLQLLPCVTSV